MMHDTQCVKIGNSLVGPGQSTYVIAEIGINHNGSLDVTRKLIEGAKAAGCDAVKFQKRTPELCVPESQWNVERDTPWGRMKYIDYRRKVEFGHDDYQRIDRWCKEAQIDWFASCWDVEAVQFIERHNPPCYKVASASLTDRALLQALEATQRPIIISTGMSTQEEVDATVDLLGRDNLLIAHSTSTYPCPVEELNLRMIDTLAKKYRCPIGYSGHETGLATTWAAVALGACFVERHITLDRAMWGSDQAASVELGGLGRLVSQLRDIEAALGDGVKRLYESEVPFRQKLRRYASLSA